MLTGTNTDDTIVIQSASNVFHHIILVNDIAANHAGAAQRRNNACAKYSENHLVAKYIAIGNSIIWIAKNTNTSFR